MVTENKGGEKEHEHAIRIWVINEDRLRLMQHKLSDTPKLLSVAAGRDTCSIFKVPQTLIDINGKSYQPHIVSIGPYHHGLPHLQMIEEHKWRYLHQLLNRTQTNGMLLEHYLMAVQPLEVTAREYYSESILYSSDEFIEMMVLDGCFIIELFRKFGRMIETDKFDPLITKLWIVSFLSRDLIKLENQIPFFVLERLFDLTKMPSDKSSPTLATLALGFFSYTLQRPVDVLENHTNRVTNIKAKHLLDLLRSFYLPPELVDPRKSNNLPPPHIIHSISKLRRAGIKLKPSDADSFLVVSFKKGTIHMPTIAIDDFMCAFLLNSVAFEQSHSGCSKHFTTYVTLLDCLINTPKDVGYLCDWNIIENNLGTEEDVALFVNSMGKDSSFDIDSCYLAKIFYDVNRHYHSDWHVHLASFRYTYFDTPWSFISALAAFILLVLTVVQTVYTVVGYVDST